jgi:hypothetical protein
VSSRRLLFCSEPLQRGHAPVRLAAESDEPLALKNSRRSLRNADNQRAAKKSRIIFSPNPGGPKMQTFEQRNGQRLSFRIGIDRKIRAAELKDFRLVLLQGAAGTGDVPAPVQATQTGNRQRRDIDAPKRLRRSFERLNDCGAE